MQVNPIVHKAAFQTELSPRQVSHHALVHFCQIHTWSEEEHVLMAAFGLNRPQI